MTYSVGDRLEAVNRRPAGFDYMRIVLATLVVLTHTTVVAYGPVAHIRIWGGWMRPPHALILPMFFALSGFLVAGSLERCRTLISFIGLRVIRIVPALAVETTLSALLLGPFFTSLPLHEYFQSRTFQHYFLNIVGRIHFLLPGVFEHNPKAGVVNGQLWTLPFELQCYAALAVVAFFTIVHRPRWFVPLVSVLTVGLLVYCVEIKHIPRTNAVDGSVLVLSFLWGVVIFLSRARIPWSAPLAAAAAVVSLACLAIPGADHLAALPAAYLTVYVGLLNPRRMKILFSGDYSYGVFLYGYPIQQAAVALFGPMSWWENMAIAFPVTVGWAALSWWFVEKPALALRVPLARLEDAGIRLSHVAPAGRLLLPYTGAAQFQKTS